jgi:hypothetical protein
MDANCRTGKGSQSSDMPITVAPARFVTIHLASTITGLSAGAIRTKIARSIWVEGREYVRAPDGHLMIDLRGYEAWVQQTAPPERARRRGA